MSVNNLGSPFSHTPDTPPTVPLRHRFRARSSSDSTASCLTQQVYGASQNLQSAMGYTSGPTGVAVGIHIDSHANFGPIGYFDDFSGDSSGSSSRCTSPTSSDGFDVAITSLSAPNNPDGNMEMYPGFTQNDHRNITAGLTLADFVCSRNLADCVPSCPHSHLDENRRIRRPANNATTMTLATPQSLQASAAMVNSTIQAMETQSDDEDKENVAPAVLPANE